MAIQRYIQDPKKVEARLMKYAKLLHVEKSKGGTGSVAIKNMAASVLTRLKNQSKEEGMLRTTGSKSCTKNVMYLIGGNL